MDFLVPDSIAFIKTSPSNSHSLACLETTVLNDPQSPGIYKEVDIEQMLVELNTIKLCIFITHR